MRWRSWGVGQPLVLLHGGFGSWLHWIHNIGPLASRYRVIAADLPGLGESANPPEPVTPAVLGEVVGDGLASLLAPDERAHLVGFSFGGLTSGQVAHRLGERIESITLVGASGLKSSRPPMELVRRQPNMTQAEVDSAIRHNCRALMLARDESVDELAFHIHKTNDGNARLRSRKLSLGSSLFDVLPSVSARVHGIWGELDATAVGFLAEREATLLQLHPESTFHVIENAGHWVQFEAAADFNRTLMDVLSRYD